MIKMKIRYSILVLATALSFGCSGGSDEPKQATGETKTADQVQQETGRGKARQESQEGVSRG